ncbi:MAG: cytochrome C oxidase subunit IV family protein [Bacteroidota bacterium]
MAEKQHIVPFKIYLIILLSLLVLTGISVAVTQVQLGAFTVTVALVLASLKSALVLMYFMHLRFDNRIFTFMVAFTITIFAAVVFVTFLDYLFR